MISKKPRENLMGKRFGRLTVVSPAPDRVLKNGRHLTIWECVCDCGNTHIVRTTDLKRGAIRSCGCYRAETTGSMRLSHGATRGKQSTKLYSVWAGIKARCYRPSTVAYKYYGGKGIAMCREWVESFSAFERWANENGYAIGLSIDRIDVNGNYCPQNCRWVDDLTQANNKTTNHFLEWRGAIHTIAEWARILDIDYNVFYHALAKNDWEIEKVVMGE